MSTTATAARAEAIREVIRQAGHGSRMAEFFVERSDISPEVLRAIAGLPPPPAPRDFFRALQ